MTTRSELRMEAGFPFNVQMEGLLLREESFHVTNETEICSFFNYASLYVFSLDRVRVSNSQVNKYGIYYTSNTT